MLAHQTRTVVGFTTRAKKKTNRSWSSASASAKKIPMLSATNAERFVRSEGFGYAVMKSRIVSICSATTRARAGLGTDLGQRNMPLLRRTHARAHARTLAYAAADQGQRNSSSRSRNKARWEQGKRMDGCKILNAPMPDVDEDEGSVLDLPEEYVRAVPSRRPDIFPDLKEIKQPMPNQLPGDPEMPDEEEEEKERKENPGEPGEDDEEDENGEKISKKEKKRREREQEE